MITVIDRIDEYKQRRIEWLAKKLQNRRATDRREYVHFCAGSIDGKKSGCGQQINYARADDFVAFCPNCSTHDLDDRVFRYYGDPDEYERAERNERNERDIIGLMAAISFAFLAAAMILVLWK